MPNYIDNAKMHEAFIEYRKECNKAKRNKLPKPRIPDFLGECFLLIATRLFHKPNFCNYTYKDEMISDGIENCITYIDNYNPKQGSNPFAYFTQIIYFAFIRRIQKERKQLYIKQKLIEHSSIHDELYDEDGVESEHMVPSYIDLNNDKMNTLVRDFESNLARQKKKRQRKKKK